ncbi:hypothetical protein ACFGVR_23230 [Mucilaginibacter sp. AW1-3]
MVFARSANSTLGLAFSSETEIEHISLSTVPLFVIPHIPMLGNNFEYYFPGELNGQYTDYCLNIDITESPLVIADPRLKYPVHFGFHSFDQPFAYLGKRDDLVGQHTHFYLLKPLDLPIMDKLYRDQGACFVGLT